MWVRFTAKYTWHVTPAVAQVFKSDGGPFKDGRYAVTRACAADAAAKGVAVAVEKPNRRPS